MKKPAMQSQVNPSQPFSDSGSAAAPTGGWNSRDAIANMAPSDAVVLDNFFPSSSSVDLRKGTLTWATGLGSRVKTLMGYASPTSKKLFACTNAGVYDITAGGAVGAAVTTLTEGYCQFVNMGTSAGSFLLSVNGIDNLKLYDGTTWTDITAVSAPAITGIVTSTIVNINIFQRRVWLIKKDSLDVWYLPSVSIAGAATQFALNSLFVRGGFLMSMATWTIDGGSGTDDFAAFVTSEGEIAIYQGSDPASPSTFGLVGVYYIGEPLGRRCMTKYGGDLLYLCKQGLFPLSKALQTASIDRTQALSDKISPTVSESASLYGNNQGWQTTVFPTANMILVNVPAFVGTASYQYVMNTISQAWGRFLDQNASCFFVWNSRLFYGSETSVIEAWVGPSDNGAYITGTALTAYSYLQFLGQKHFKLVRPTLQVTGPYDLCIGADTDFANTVDYSIILSGSSGGDLWDVGLWDVAVWGGGPSIVQSWSNINVNSGYAIAAKMMIRTKLSSISWVSTDYIYERGGML